MTARRAGSTPAGVRPRVGRVSTHRIDPDCVHASVHELAAAWVAVGTAPVLVVTGAEVSRASGLPTFRGTEPGAILSTQVIERGTRRFFIDDPAESWRRVPAGDAERGRPS